MIGVDYELFWTLNPKTLSPFIKAFSLRQQYDDTLAWNNGRYIALAIASNFSKEQKYPRQPLLKDRNVDEILKPKSEEEKAKESQEEIKRKFMERMNILNHRFGKED